MCKDYWHLILTPSHIRCLNFEFLDVKLVYFKSNNQLIEFKLIWGCLYESFISIVFYLHPVWSKNDKNNVF